MECKIRFLLIVQFAIVFCCCCSLAHEDGEASLLDKDSGFPETLVKNVTITNLSKLSEIGRRGIGGGRSGGSSSRGGGSRSRGGSGSRARIIPGSTYSTHGHRRSSATSICSTVSIVAGFLAVAFVVVVHVCM